MERFETAEAGPHGVAQDNRSIFSERWEISPFGRDHGKVNRPLFLQTLGLVRPGYASGQNNQLKKY